MKSSFLFISILLFHFLTFAQKNNVLTGTIYSSIDSLPIADVSIYLVDKIISKSDQNGYFNFSVKDNNSDSLFFKVIGFKTLVIAVKEMKQLKYNKFFLLPDTINLKEIEVKLDFYQIFKEALSNKSYYVNETYQSMAFVREIIKQDSNYVKLSEGVLLINNPPYKSSNYYQGCLLGLRKSANHSKTKFFDSKRDINSKIFNLNAFLKSNEIEGDSSKLKYYNFTLLGIDNYQNEAVYKIKLEKNKLGKKKLKDNKKEGIFFLTIHNPTIVYIEVYGGKREGRKNAFEYKRILGFAKTNNNKWYMDNTVRHLKRNIYSIQNKVFQYQEIIFEYKVNKIFNPSDVLPKCSQSYTSESLYNADFTYDPVFWNNYTKEYDYYPISKEVLKSLEQNTTLEEQYRKTHLHKTYFWHYDYSIQAKTPLI